MSEDKKPRELRTLSLIAETAVLDKLYEDLASLGWKLKYRGHSGSWLAEPIYDVRNTNEQSQSDTIPTSENNNKGSSDS